MIEGFAPFVNPDSRVLILGSFPSVKSREEGFYYGNKQNRFWSVLAQSFASPAPRSVNEKKELLRRNKVALWDVVTSCDIVGSMDKDIKNPVIADIKSLAANYPIAKIITNGGTAYKLFAKHFPELTGMCVALPSTSPANARLDKSVWINELRR